MFLLSFPPWTIEVYEYIYSLVYTLLKILFHFLNEV